jgi:hypothetical protein
MSKPSAPIVIPSADWNTSALRYMQPKISDRGSKSINIISTQSNRSIHVASPPLMTWGIADFVDEKGESDGKFSISLNFPGSGYETPATNDFLAKMKAFEEQVLDDAVKNSEAWFGEQMERSVVKHTFFPFLKYSKDKLTKKIDPSKPPSIRAKVPNYNGKWSVEVYDVKGKLLFPCDNGNATPMDFVQKKSNVACVLQCGGLWFGGKGWGITWKLNQCVVKPNEVQSIFGKCHIQLSPEDVQALEKADTSDVAQEDDDVAAAPNVEVDDSDAEEEQVAEPIVVKKKVVKKAADPVAEQVQEPVAAETDAEPAVVKKKVVKKAAPKA